MEKIGVKITNQEDLDFIRDYYKVERLKLATLRDDRFIQLFDSDQSAGKYCAGYAIDKVISFQEFLKLKNINIMKYKEGDILIDRDGDKTEILGVCGKVYIVSDFNNFNCYGMIRTQQQLDERDFKLFTEEPMKEVTLADISKAMNIPIDKLRIKD